MLRAGSRAVCFLPVPSVLKQLVCVCLLSPGEDIRRWCRGSTPKPWKPRSLHVPKEAQQPREVWLCLESRRLDRGARISKPSPELLGSLMGAAA